MTLKHLTEKIRNNQFDLDDLLTASLETAGDVQAFIVALSKWLEKHYAPVVIIEDNPAIVATTMEDEEYMRSVVDALSPEATEALKSYIGE